VGSEQPIGCEAQEIALNWYDKEETPTKVIDFIFTELRRVR
jgi:hypothetical protein